MLVREKATESMTIKPQRNATAALILCLAIAGGTEEAAGIGSSFTYQGFLRDGGNPAQGAYDFEFRIWDDPAAGTETASPVARDSVAVADGIFTVGLDFGAGQFAGEARWLEISVRYAGGGAYTPLTPRVELAPVPNALFASDAGQLGGIDASGYVERYGSAYVIVGTTGDAAENGVSLLAAYDSACLLTPHGQPLSATNRAAVLVPPGAYDLGTAQIEMDCEFVDLIGLSTKPRDQHIYGISAGLGTGVLHQSANDVGIENVWLHCTRDSGTPGGLSDAISAYFPESNLPLTVVRNCVFEGNSSHAHGMRLNINYSGTYEKCVSDFGAFGGMGLATGKFTDCVGGWDSFAGQGTAAGTFERCVGSANSFGGSRGTASGTFIDCVGGSYAFGGGGFMSTSSGLFIRCRAGTESFGGGSPLAHATGTFIECIGGDGAFGGNGSSSDGGVFQFCIGGPGSFSTPATATHLFCTVDAGGVQVQYPNND